jgi:hypothetical protein
MIHHEEHEEHEEKNTADHRMHGGNNPTEMCFSVMTPGLK